MEPPSTRTLVVMRHAKSDWPPGVPDRERPLTKRGRRDATAAGEWLQEKGYVPDRVVVSPAQRTRETWEQLSGAWSSAAAATFDKRIYEAAVASLVEVVHGFDEDTRTALLLGHNPGVHGLVVALAGQGDEGARALASVGFPTSGVAVLSVPGRWSKLGAGKATLTTFTVPRG